MKRISWRLVLLMIGLLPVRLMADEIWKGTWNATHAGSEKAMTLRLTRTDEAIAGSVEIDGQTLVVTGKVEGTWREVVWKDGAGRVTQFRGVVSGRTWTGLTIAGGDGRLVDYGRVKMIRTP